MQEEGLSLEGGSAPCNPLRRSSPFPTLSFAKVPGPRRSAGADFASLYPPHGSRRHACCLGLAGPTGQQAAGAESPQSSPATAVLQPPTTVMGGGGAPKHIQIMKLDGQHIDHPREPPEIVYSGGDSPIALASI